MYLIKPDGKGNEKIITYGFESRTSPVRSQGTQSLCLCWQYLTHSCPLHSSSFPILYQAFGPLDVTHNSPVLYQSALQGTECCAVSIFFLITIVPACLWVACLWQEPSINQTSARGHLHISWLSSMGQTCPSRGQPAARRAGLPAQLGFCSSRCRTCCLFNKADSSCCSCSNTIKGCVVWQEVARCWLSCMLWQAGQHFMQTPARIPGKPVLTGYYVPVIKPFVGSADSNMCTPAIAESPQRDKATFPCLHQMQGQDVWEKTEVPSDSPPKHMVCNPWVSLLLLASGEWLKVVNMGQATDCCQIFSAGLFFHWEPGFGMDFLPPCMLWAGV